MMNLINALFQVASFNLEKNILNSVMCAKLDLGLDYQDEYKAHNAMKYSGATYVSSIRIIGWTRMAMYDDMPIEFASFDRDTNSTFSINPQTLQSAKQFITPQYLLDSWYDTEGYKHPENENAILLEGMTGLEVIDNLGNVVAYAKVNLDGEVQWNESVAMSESEIEKANIQVKEIYSEASLEASWDNFETARNLRNQAQAISRKIAIALNAKRLVSIN